jgi:thioredoxin
MATDVTETTFENEVIEGSKETPVLVDFWAEWCGPCHAVSPVLQKIADEREGALKLVKVNIDENQELAGRYGIMSIPTMILFKDGEPAAAAIGARPKGDLERQLGLAEAAV